MTRAWKLRKDPFFIYFMSEDEAQHNIHPFGVSVDQKRWV